MNKGQMLKWFSVDGKTDGKCKLSDITDELPISLKYLTVKLDEMCDEVGYVSIASRVTQTVYLIRPAESKHQNWFYLKHYRANNQCWVFESPVGGFNVYANTRRQLLDKITDDICHSNIVKGRSYYSSKAKKFYTVKRTNQMGWY